MLQREVVDRLIASPGGKEYGYLSVMVQLYSTLDRLFDVPPGAFRPAPKVHSSVCRARVSLRPLIDVSDEAQFRETAQIIFAQRRKTLLNNLRAARSRLGLIAGTEFEGAFEACGLDLRRRAETLSLSEIARLSDFLSDLKAEASALDTH